MLPSLLCALCTRGRPATLDGFSLRAQPCSVFGSLDLSGFKRIRHWSRPYLLGFSTNLTGLADHPYHSHEGRHPEPLQGWYGEHYRDQAHERLRLHRVR